MRRRRLGLLVNPIAGLGGTVALNGTDGLADEALRRGAWPLAIARTVAALNAIARGAPDVDIYCYDNAMGGSPARTAGFIPRIVGGAASDPSSAHDTRAAARILVDADVELLLFAGGDGTACDVYEAVGTSVPLLGIPAGVKMQSGVFATTPAAAGTLVSLYFEDRKGIAMLRDADIMDIDEAARSRGRLAARLHGTAPSPYQQRLRQNPKAGGGPDEPDALHELAASVAGSLADGTIYLLGPGTTMAAIKAQAGIRGTLLGVDAVRSGKVLGLNLGEPQILRLLARNTPAHLIVSPLGSQGFVFGRGNQQLSVPVLRSLGRDNITIVATAGKIVALGGAGLLVDTGDETLDRELAGWHRVITGPNQSTMYRIAV